MVEMDQVFWAHGDQDYQLQVLGSMIFPNDFLDSDGLNLKASTGRFSPKIRRFFATSLQVGGRFGSVHCDRGGFGAEFSLELWTEAGKIKTQWSVG